MQDKIIIIGDGNSRYSAATATGGPLITISLHGPLPYYQFFFRMCSTFLAVLYALCAMPCTICLQPNALRRTPDTPGLIYLFYYSGGDQGQQDFMVADEIDALTAFGGGAADDIGQGAIVFDEIQVDCGKICQGVPQISHQGGGF